VRHVGTATVKRPSREEAADIADCGFNRKEPSAASRNQRSGTTDFTDKGDLSTQSRQVAKTQRRKELPALQTVRIAHFREDFPISVSICVNLWPIPISAAAGRAAPFCSAIPENCAFLAKFPERCSPMTNDKFSMTNSQFRSTTLVAAPPRCAFAALRLSTACPSVLNILSHYP
jgi:hypothetical protein